MMQLYCIGCFFASFLSVDFGIQQVVKNGFKICYLKGDSLELV